MRFELNKVLQRIAAINRSWFLGHANLDKIFRHVFDHPSAKFKELGKRMVKNMTENLIKIGVAQKPAPIYRRNVLKNFVEFKTHSYEYYRTYPYRGTQWYLDE